jgi:uncharacterized protein
MLDRNHPFFELARRGKRITRAILAAVLSIVFVLVAQIIGALVLVTVTNLVTGQPLSLSVAPGTIPRQPVPQALVFVVQLGLSFGLVFVLLALWTRYFEKRALWTVGYSPSSALTKYVRGLLLGLLMFGGPVLIQAALGYVEFEAGPVELQGAVALGGVLIVLIGWMIQGAAEEALTRGWLMQTIGARYRPWIAVLVSSLVFVLLHGMNPNTTALAFANLFLFSLFAAAYTLREGGLWGISAWHTIWNWAQGNLFGLQVSGTDAPGGILVNLRESGPDIITGGTFGPEGGLLVSVVLLIGIAVIVISARNRPKPVDAVATMQ